MSSTKKDPPAVHPDFYQGVLCALAIVANHDAETIFHEIVSSVGETGLIAAACQTGIMKWSGLTRYDYKRGLRRFA